MFIYVTLQELYSKDSVKGLFDHACSIDTMCELVDIYKVPGLLLNTICYNTLKSYLATDHTCGHL